MAIKNHRKIKCADLRQIQKELTGNNGDAMTMLELANIVAGYKDWPMLDGDKPHKKEYAKQYLYMYMVERDKVTIPAKAKNQECFVYFIQSGENGPVKIGVAKDVEARVAALQTGCAGKINILVKMVFDGRMAAFAYENELHRQFAEYRINGEWFNRKILSKLHEARHESAIEAQQKSVFDYVAANRNFPKRFKLREHQSI